MNSSKYEKFLHFIKDKNILILTHDLVDLDGFASVHLLHHLCNRLFPEILCSIAFSNISRSTRNFIHNFSKKFDNINLSENKNTLLSDIKLVIVLDTNNLDLVKFPQDYEESITDAPIIFIDHHLDLEKRSEDIADELNLIFEDFSSTTEIICDLYKHNRLEIPHHLKMLAISAILTDSGFFKFANKATFKHFSELFDERFEYQDILDLLEHESDVSERIAKIKGLQRVKLRKVGVWLIGISDVSSYSAVVASMLLSVGCDISVVCSKDNSKQIITTRATRSICSKTGLHLGKLLSELDEGSGGGHDGAASINGTFDLELVKNKILEKIEQTLIGP